MPRGSLLFICRQGMRPHYWVILNLLALFNHFVLVVFGADKQPCLFTGSEWSSLDPSYRYEPVFGVFDESGHSGFGGSADWLDASLFVLRSIELVNERFNLSGPDLNEGEAWALTRLLRQLKEDTPSPHHESYLAALGKHDKRVTRFLENYMGTN